MDLNEGNLWKGREKAGLISSSIGEQNHDCFGEEKIVSFYQKDSIYLVAKIS